MSVSNFQLIVSFDSLYRQKGRDPIFGGWINLRICTLLASEIYTRHFNFSLTPLHSHSQSMGRATLYVHTRDKATSNGLAKFIKNIFPNIDMKI